MIDAGTPGNLLPTSNSEGQDQCCFCTHSDSFQKLNIAVQSLLHNSSIERSHGNTTPAVNDSNPVVSLLYLRK